MKKILLTFLAVSFLSACAIMPKDPVLTAEPITVDDNLDEYWISQNDNPFVSHTQAQLRIMRQEDVRIHASYLIDSNGNVYNVTIDQTPYPGVFDKVVAESLQKRKFIAAESNPSRQPVYARSQITYGMNR